jgi:holo-[acyl-carrier-protein] synthase
LTMIAGVGVDIVAVERMARALARHEAALFRRVFTAGEQADCRSEQGRAAHFAARFAAKEAVMKALGCGWGPVGWREVEIRRSASGRPVVALHGRAARWAQEQGIAAVYVSLAHEKEYAIAYAVAVAAR